MRALLALLVATSAAAAAAGCLDDGSYTLITAQEAEPTAARAAGRWADDAALVAAFGLEFGPDARRELAEDLREARAELEEERREGELDEEDLREARDELALMEAVVSAGNDAPGDGRASVWVFSYRSDAMDESRYIAVASDGIVVDGSDDFDASDFGGRPLTEWPVDSDVAASAAREGDATYVAASGDPSAVAFTILVQGDDHPYWLLGVETENESLEEALVVVDAVNGTVVDVEELLPDLVDGLLLQEFGTDSGTFTAAIEVSATSEFMVQLGGHEALAVHVSVSPPTAMPTSVTVTGPDGLEESFEVAFAPGVAAEESVLMRAPRGEYTVTLQVPIAARHTWSLSWCTDGEEPSFGFDFGFEVPACEEVGGGFEASPAPHPVHAFLDRLQGHE